MQQKLMLIPNVDYFRFVSHYGDISTDGIDTRVDKLKNNIVGKSVEKSEYLRRHYILSWFLQQ